MGQVLVRNLENDVIEAIKLKAGLKGHSLEEELREITRSAAPLTPEERVALSRKILRHASQASDFGIPPKLYARQGIVANAGGRRKHRYEMVRRSSPFWISRSWYRTPRNLSSHRNS